MTTLNRIKNAWNAFCNKDPTNFYKRNQGFSYGYRPDRYILNPGNERSIISSIMTRIAIDVAKVSILHVQTDDNDRYTETIKDSLNDCLTLEANKDQTGRAFIQDIVMSLFDEGCIAVVPIFGSKPDNSERGFIDIDSMRTGKILEWAPNDVRVRIYDETDAQHKEIVVSKYDVAIIENPLYAVMNEPNSTLKRLIHKLNLLDRSDDQIGSHKLDMIIQLPYTIKTQTKREQAEARIKDIELQLETTKYGIAYADATEKITQLNRAVENNLLPQIESLKKELYGQLGLDETIFNGTATEETMLNYYDRTIEPVVSAIVDEFKRKFLTKTAREHGESIMFFRDPFRLVPVKDLAEIADKFTRNEILSSNEIRVQIGYKPDSNPKSDELINSNINQAGNQNPVLDNKSKEKEEENQNGV